MTAPQHREGYVADVAYPRHFHRETMPMWLAAVLTALGRRAPDLTRPYTWLDLGCGSGLSTVVAAATNPLGRFIGIDFDPTAIAQAQALAREAGVDNAHFHCLSFDQALQAEDDVIPPCDFLVTHGVYSWVSAAHRTAIRGIVDQRLKPGGVLYVAYMSHPGSVSFSAAQRLMRMAAGTLPGSSAERARGAADWLQRLARAGAGYFVEHPAARNEVERMGQDDGGYLAHELLNAHWEALHVAEVMTEFAAVGCEWAGSATSLENIDAVSLPAATQPLLAELRRGGADATLVETFKDVARNQNQRRDIYQRAAEGGAMLSPDAHRQALLAQRVGLLPAAPEDVLRLQGELRFDTRIGPVLLPVAQAAPLLAALQGGPRSYAELARLPAYAAEPGFISLLLQVLGWAGWLHVLRPDQRSPGVIEPDAAAHRLQAVLATQPSPSGGPILVASAIGSAIPARDSETGEARTRRQRALGVHV